MKKNDFVHLHLHSEYSILDSSARIKDIIKKVKDNGQDAVALTDHGVMYGVIDFYKEAKKEGIKPIIGSEVYVANTHLGDKDVSEDNFYYHLILLAENQMGYDNLVKLVSIGFTDGFYYRPRVDIETLKQHSEGLIALSACVGGVITKAITKYGYDKAVELAKVYNDIFGQDNFFIEIQDHGIELEKRTNPLLIKMASELNIPLVATNDCHYTYPEDYSSHEVLVCIGMQRTIYENNNVYEGGQFYIKDTEEMYELFPNQNEAILNTKKIAQRCDVEFVFNEYKLPKYDVPDGYDAYKYLEKVTNEGLSERYETITEEIQTRLNFELDLIKTMGFVDYFLIVWDFIKYARDNDIAVGPGRGSAAGSIISYALKITSIDPIKYGLIFERFLNPERVSMPDIDIDFCEHRRGEVIAYVGEKYGHDRVAQIITFGTMAARGSIRDTGRALNMPYAECQRIANMIPKDLGITIEKALKINKDLQFAYNEESDVKQLIDMALKLEGLPRNVGTHAAGVVISDKSITNYVPVNQRNGQVNTQFPMTTLEELGLLKMDFLGLTTLTIIQNAVREINIDNDNKLDIDKIPIDDENVYKMISEAKTEGVFQLESAGMKAFMKELQPSTFEDIIAGISLYRPGPMDFIPKYVAGKRNKDNIIYTHKALEPILKETYGCIVYQEQVMQIVRDLAGYDMGRSDMVRRAMSKKKTDVMNKERVNFVEGASKNGIDKASAEKIFDEMTDFAKYAFNKSHAAAYAMVGYQTAYLRYYYKSIFMASVLSSASGSMDKVTGYINTCKEMGIEVLPPDINESFLEFSVTNDKIRFGMSAIKNVGTGIVNSIIVERQTNGLFTSMTNFIRRMHDYDINKRCVESLILAGAFDSFGGTRLQYMNIYLVILSSLSSKKKNNIAGQLDLFSIGTEDSEVFDDNDELPNVGEYTKRELLSYEKDVIGLYITGHPVLEYKEIIEKNATNISSDFVYNDEEDKMEGVLDEIKVTYGGIVAKITVKYTKNNDKMAFLNVEDEYGNVEIVVFPKIFSSIQGRIEEGSPILIKGTSSIKEEENGKILANTITFIDDLKEEKTSVLWLKFNNEETEKKIIDLLIKYKGNSSVYVYNELTKTKQKLNNQFNVQICDNLMQELTEIVGKNNIIVKNG